MELRKVAVIALFVLAGIPRVSAGGSQYRGVELGPMLSARLRESQSPVRKVAVLNFENNASEKYGDFVRGLGDMLMTSFGQGDGLTVIERVQIEKAMSNFHMEMSGPIDAEKAVEIGQWLGADAVVLGSFTRFGAVFRIDGRLINARTGELMVAEHVRGSEEEVMVLVDELGKRLIESFGKREEEVNGEMGDLEIRFTITKTEMGERPVYYHLCKVYVDGNYMGTTPVVERAEEWHTLFAREVKAGKRNVELVHGYVRDGKWDGEMPKQPQVFQVDIESNSIATIQYSYEVGWFADQFLYQHPWRGVPR